VRFGWTAFRFVTIRAAILISLALVLPVASTGQAMKVQQRNISVRPDVVCLLCTLTVTATPNTVNFNLVSNGVANGSSPVTITTTMSGLASLLGTINLYGYFTTPTAALVGQVSAADKIPSSAVFGQDPNGLLTSWTAFTQTTPLGGAGGLAIYSHTYLISVLLPVTHTDVLSLRIDLTSLPQLPADTYTGTLTLQAQEF